MVELLCSVQEERDVALLHIVQEVWVLALMFLIDICLHQEVQE